MVRKARSARRVSTAGDVVPNHAVLLIPQRRQLSGTGAVNSIRLFETG